MTGAKRRRPSTRMHHERKILFLTFCVGVLTRPSTALLPASSARFRRHVTSPRSVLVSSTRMVTGTSNRQDVQLPSGRFAACWPVGLGTYNGGAAVFLASGRRILDPREEVFPLPISEESVALLAEASERLWRRLVAGCLAIDLQWGRVANALMCCRGLLCAMRYGEEHTLGVRKGVGTRLMVKFSMCFSETLVGM